MRARLLLFLFLAGVILFAAGIVSYLQEADAKPEPDVVTAAELVAKGAPDNLHVRITDASPAPHEAVKLTIKKRGSTIAEDAFLPLTTMPTRFGEQPALAAIARMKLADFTAYRGGPVQGMRVKTFAGLDSKVADRLAIPYGKDAVDKAPVIEFGRQPAGLGAAFMFLGLGALAIAGGILLLLCKPAASAARLVVPTLSPSTASYPPAPPPPAR